MVTQPHIQSENPEEIALPNVEGIRDDLFKDHQRYGYSIGSLNFLVEENLFSEVLEEYVLFPLPNTPNEISGLINLRGLVVPVFDLYSFLNEDKGKRLDQKLLVLGESDKTLAVLVDTIPKIINIEETSDEIPNLPTQLKNHIESAAKSGSETWLEFDYLKFFKSLAV